MDQWCWMGFLPYPSPIRGEFRIAGPTTVIHVVDDDALFSTAIARLLRASGYEVALYESGDQLLGARAEVTQNNRRRKL
jgi:ActR/RegA family two-component response regulator